MIVNFQSQSFHNLAKQNKTAHLPISLDRVGVIILGGGEGKRLAPLTTSRCKPAVCFGGRYSLIDVPISHSLTSGLNKIFVIGQYLAYTLQKHLFQTYLNYGLAHNQIQLLVPEEREGEKIWFNGTADAVRKNLNYFLDVDVDYFLILSGDQLYNINFQEMIQFGLETDASMVVAAQTIRESEAKRMGLLRLDKGSSRLIDFHEKPQEQEVLERFYVDDFTMHRLGFDSDEGKNYLGSMGIYFFKKEALFQLLKEDPREDFGKHLITTEINKGTVHAYLYDGYWEDIGTIRSYYEANLALTKKVSDQKKGLHCYQESSRILTKAYNLPGACIQGCQIHNALICEGSIVEASQVSNSVLGVRSVVRKGSVIQDSVLIGNEFYEKAPNLSGEPYLQPEIGENCLISKAIIDENVRIGREVVLTNENNHENYQSPDGKLIVRDGVIVVPKGTVIPHNYRF